MLRQFTALPADILIAYLVAMVCFLAAFWGLCARLKAGDAVQHWLDVTDEPTSIRELTQRPWSLPAAKGIQSNGRRVVPFQRKRVEW